nr:uncharacterized protein LOC109179592 [Ipomoea trifida]
MSVNVDRDVGGPSQVASEEQSNAYHRMVMDAAGVEFNVDEIEESPNPEAQKFYDMLKAADQELFPKWYYVNGFKFHTIGYGGAKETMNSGVCIKGINYSVDESDYYGRLVEVVQVEYPGLPITRIILFKCEWFDPTSVGMKVHPKYKLVEVNHKRRFNRYDWWAVCKIKARSNVEVHESSISTEESLIHAPFQEETTDNHDLVQIDEDPLDFDDPNGAVIELDGEHGDIEDETELEEEIDYSSGYSIIGDSDNGGRAGSTRGRGRGALDTPPLVEPIVAPLPTVVSPPVQSPASINSLVDLPIPSPSNSTAPPTASSVAGSSIEILQVDESIEAQIRKAFLAQASLRYADMLSKFKNKRTSTGRPACVAEETWAIWEAYWDRPDVKAKSEQQRKNRMSEVEGPGTGCSKHTGGSRSAIEHYHKCIECKSMKC